MWWRLGIEKHLVEDVIVLFGKLVSLFFEGQSLLNFISQLSRLDFCDRLTAMLCSSLRLLKRLVVKSVGLELLNDQIYPITRFLSNFEFLIEGIDVGLVLKLKDDVLILVLLAVPVIVRLVVFRYPQTSVLILFFRTFHRR